jgi:peptidyl-dipeptidase A
LRHALEVAQWDAACDATEANRKKVEAEANAFDKARHDPQGIARVERSLAEDITSPLVRRALECLRLELLPHQKPRPAKLVRRETEAEAHFSRFRAEVDGKRLAANEVDRILREERDGTVLERTWRAAMRVGEEIQDTVRELARLRNQHARSLGENDYRALRLRCEEIDPVWLDGFLGELARGTKTAWMEMKADLDRRRAARFGTEPEALCAWHYGGVFVQEPPADEEIGDPLEGADLVNLTRRTFEDVGLDVDAVLERSDLFPREGKNQHAFCTHLDRAGDVRVLCNIVPNQRWAGTMLHEFGHAAYDLALDFGLPWNLVRPPHASVTEAVAMLFGRQAYATTWREEVAGLVDDGSAERRLRESLLCFVRWGLVVSVFERHLYADPEQDLDAVWWDLVERYQGISRPDPAPPGAWAAKIHVACYPVYYHAYLMGECIASQLARHIRDHVPGHGLVGNPDAGRFLRRELFHPAASVPWNDLVERVTGSKVRASALLAELTPAVGST